MNDTISITKTEKSRISHIDFKNLDFGSSFSDHQFVVDFKKGSWQDARVVPYGPMMFSPASSVFHYGQAVFEGLKAFTHESGKINVFRMDRNYERMANSCRRLSMAVPTKEHFMDGIAALLELDKQWVPSEKFKALYIRPFVIATEPVIRLKSSDEYMFFVITSPVGNYYKEGINPVSLTTTPDYVRAVKGGIGSAKAAGNYASSLYPAKQAQQNGFTQVLWLDAIEKKYVEEVGTMNIFFMIGDTLVTPALSGSILPGVTRDSVLYLAKNRFKMNVEERAVSIDELKTAYDKGMLKEVFGAGTAAVISPVGSITHNGEKMQISETMGETAKMFYDEITGIQHGTKESPENWSFLF